MLDAPSELAMMQEPGAGLVRRVADLDVVDVHQRGSEQWYFKLRPGSYQHKHFSEQGLLHDCTVNVLGFRGAPFSPAKPAGTIRVGVLGGSTAMGAYSPEDETLAGWLQRDLEPLVGGKGATVEVLNFAIPGHHLKLTWQMLSQELVRYQPDMLVLYTGSNDANPHVIMDQEGVTRTFNRVTGWLHAKLYYASMAYTVAVEKYAVWRNRDPIPFIERYPYREKFEGYLGRIADLANQRGMRLVLVKELMNDPETAWAESVPSLEELERRFERDTRLTMAQVYPMRQRILQKAIERFAKTHALPYVDPSSAFAQAQTEAGAPLFFDHLHLTSAGNRLLANTVAPVVAQEITR